MTPMRSVTCTVSSTKIVTHLEVSPWAIFSKSKTVSKLPVRYVAMFQPVPHHILTFCGYLHVFAIWP